MKKNKLLALLLLMTFLFAGCGINSKVDEGYDKEDKTEDTSSDKSKGSVGSELEVTSIESYILRNANDDIVISAKDDDEITEEESPLKVEAKFEDSNGDGIVNGKSREKIYSTVTFNNTDNQDYVLSSLSFVTTSEGQTIEDLDESLAEDGFERSSHTLEYQSNFTVPAKESISMTIGSTIDSEIYDEEFHPLIVRFVANPEEGKGAMSFDLTYNVKGEESNGDEFEVEEAPSGFEDIEGVFKVGEEQFVVNTDGNFLLGGTGDEQYTGRQGREVTNFDPKLVVTDKSGDGVLDLTEEAHAKITITNNTKEDYDISKFSVSTHGISTKGGEVKNLKNDNTGDQELAVEEDSDGISPADDGDYFIEFTLKAGDTATIEFDFSMDPREDDKTIMTPSNSLAYITFDFEAQVGEDDSTMFSYNLNDNIINFAPQEDDKDEE